MAKLSDAVGPEEPNLRPDVVKVETFLDRTGHLDLARTDGPTGYYGSRVDKSIRDFQRDGGLKVDGLVNPGGPTLRSLGTKLFDDGRAHNKAPPAETLALRSTNLLGSFAFVSEARAESPTSVEEYPNFPRSSGSQNLGFGSKKGIPTAKLRPHAQLDKGSPGRPVINSEKDRIEAILNDTPALFEIEDNPNADGADPGYVIISAGRAALVKIEKIIDEEAVRSKVDPDLVKAIVFAENARDHYYGGAELFDVLGLSNTLFPMNINPKIWARLGLNEVNRRDPTANIRAGVTLITRLDANYTS